MLLRTDIENLTVADLQALCDAGVEEARDLEFKQALPGSKDAEKTEFLKDVSALANTDGGHIVYGIKEGKHSNAETLVALSVSSTDQEELRLSQMAISGIAPRLPHLRFRWLSHSGGHLLVIYVGRSFVAPHQITYNEDRRFYGRATRGTFRMDASQVREAVLGSTQLAERVRVFVRGRIEAMVKNGPGTITLDQQPRWVIHVVPIQHFLSTSAIEPRTLVHQANLVMPPVDIARYAFDIHTMFEGLVRTAFQDQRPRSAYSLVFRSGSCEGVTTSPCRSPDGQAKVVAGNALVGRTTRYIQDCFALYRAFQIGGPFLITASLIGCTGYRLVEAEPWLWRDGIPTIDRDELYLPLIEFTDMETEFAHIADRLYPLFEALFNAAGLVQCRLYDKDGRYHDPSDGSTLE